MGNIYKEISMILITALITGFGSWASFGYDKVTQEEMQQYVAKEADAQKIGRDDITALKIDSSRTSSKIDQVLDQLQDIKKTQEEIRKSQADLDKRLVKVEK